MFGKFSFLTCKVYRAFMRGSHNLSIDLKVTKNVGRPICLMIINNFFRRFSK